MLGSGGSTVVARTMGEGKAELANRYFSMIVLVTLGLGAVFSLGGALFIEPIARLAGASDLLIDSCVAYGRILLGGSVMFMLQATFQVFFVTAELPKTGLFFSLAAGATNIVMDYLLIGPLNIGIAGAAWGTVLSYSVGGLLPLLYFFKPPRGALRLCRTRLYLREQIGRAHV